MIAAAFAVAMNTAAAGQTVQGPVVVIDGDTVVVNGVTVRLKGVDAPEWNQPGGPQATVAMRDIAGRWLKCGLTGETTHNREVGYCSNAAGEDIGQAIISRGAALSCPQFDVDRRYFKFEQPEAVQRQSRASYCLSKTTQAASRPANTYVIKGNINVRQERIYHMPGQRFNDATIIDPSKGERWFCTEDEAIDAGWQKSKV
jgi:endonuclease YncB( thermonuclease family)